MANSVYNRKAWEEFAPPEDENDEAILDESIQNATFSQTISGMNITHPEENVDINLEDMLGSINSSNTEYVQEAESKIAALRAEEIAEAEAAEAAAQAERAKKKFYEEQALRDERAFKEAQEAAALAEAERERREKSLVNKVSSMFIKPKKPKDAPEETAKVVEEVLEIPTETEEVKDSLVEQEAAPKDSDNIADNIDEKTKKKGLFGKKEKSPKKEKPNKNKNVKNDKDNNEESLLIKPAEPQPLPASSTDWEFLATHDEMTGMLNVRAYDVVKSKSPTGMSVVFVDINNLKYINDNFGHEAGNQLIKTVSASLIKHFPGEKYRIGGDEFIILMPTGNEKKTKAAIESAKVAFEKDMDKATKDSDELVFSASIGYGIGNSKTPISETIEIADKAMYEAKNAYKKAHPEFDMRSKKPDNTSSKPNSEEKKIDVDHDDLLTPEQRKLKESVAQGHEPVSQDDIRRIIADVQRKQDQIVAILIASPTFDHLFVIKQVQTFLTVAIENEDVLDYSYLYILYDGGPQYYGSDEYYSEVTHIFEALGKKIAANQLNDKTLQQVPGINVFRNIYTDLM